MTPKQIGAAVRKARGQRSIREVAGAAGLHRGQVTGIEAGTKAYTINSLLALCKAVGRGFGVQRPRVWAVRGTSMDYTRCWWQCFSDFRSSSNKATR